MQRDSEAISKVLRVTLLLNLGVAVGKLGYGIDIGMLAMAADGVHSLFDGAANVVGLLAIRAASRPPDATHPYGRRKLETFAALSIGGLLLLASYEIFKAGVSRLLAGPAELAIDIGIAGYVVMGVTMAVNFGVSTYERHEGKRLKSEVLLADSEHTRADLLTSAAVVVALVATSLGLPLVDVGVTFCIVGWVGWLAWNIIRPALATLVDEARVDPEQISRIALAVDGVLNVHHVRSRGSVDQVFVDLHIQVAPNLTVEQAHDIAHLVETNIRDQQPQVLEVLPHVEPHGDPEENLDGSVSPPHATGRGRR